MDLARFLGSAALFRVLLAALLAAGAAAASAQVYRCPQADGRLSFQDRPCESGDTVAVRPLPRMGGSMIGPRAPEDIGRAAALQGALQRGEPAIGMNEAQLAQAMGRPKRIHVSNRGRGQEVQRIYERAGRTYVVQTREGQVTAIRNRQVGEKRGTRQCPTPLAIRNAETDASSIALSAAERQQLRRQVLRMRECR